MPQKNHNLRICFDRIIPATSQTAAAQQKALSHYASLVKEQSGAPENADFGEHVSRVGVHALSASGPIQVARMAVINQKKWAKGFNLRCRFLDGDNTQKDRV